MKTPRLKLFSLLLFAAITIATLPAFGQGRIYSFQTLGGLPATIATTVTTNLASPPTIDTRQQHDVTIQLSFNQTSASTSNVLYVFQYSCDGSSWDTTKSNVITVASTGATPVILTTNINTLGAGYLRLQSIINSTALTTMTNLGVGYAIKVGAP